MKCTNLLKRPLSMILATVMVLGSGTTFALDSNRIARTDSKDSGSLDSGNIIINTNKVSGVTATGMPAGSTLTITEANAQKDLEVSALAKGYKIDEARAINLNMTLSNEALEVVTVTFKLSEMGKKGDEGLLAVNTTSKATQYLPATIEADKVSFSTKDLGAFTIVPVTAYTVKIENVNGGLLDVYDMTANKYLPVDEDVMINAGNELSIRSITKGYATLDKIVANIDGKSSVVLEGNKTKLISADETENFKHNEADMSADSFVSREILRPFKVIGKTLLTPSFKLLQLNDSNNDYNNVYIEDVYHEGGTIPVGEFVSDDLEFYREENGVIVADYESDGVTFELANDSENSESIYDNDKFKIEDGELINVKPLDIKVDGSDFTLNFNVSYNGKNYTNVKGYFSIAPCSLNLRRFVAESMSTGFVRKGTSGWDTPYAHFVKGSTFNQAFSKIDMNNICLEMYNYSAPLWCERDGDSIDHNEVLTDVYNSAYAQFPGYDLVVNYLLNDPNLDPDVDTDPDENNHFIVTFYSEKGATSIFATEITETDDGKEYADLPDDLPNKKDSLFLGWVDENGNNFTGETPVTANVKLYGTWGKAIKPTIEADEDVDEILGKNLDDIMVSGSGIPDGVKLVLVKSEVPAGKQSPQEAAASNLGNNIATSGNVITLDIKLTMPDGTPIPAGTRVTLRLPIPNGISVNMGVLTIHYGSQTEVQIAVVGKTDKTITISTTGFSPFAFVNYERKSVTPPKPDNGGGSGGSGGGGSSRSRLTGLVKKTTVSAPKPITNSVAVSEAKKAATAAKNADLKTMTVRFKNASSISAQALKSIADIAAKNKLDVKVYFDTVVGNSVVSRIYIDPSKYNLTTDLVLGVTIGDKAVESAFKNKAVVVNLSQKNSLGLTSEIAVKSNLTPLGTAQKLYVYSYDAVSKKHTLLASSTYMDTAGYLHFTTSVGGYIVISSTPIK